MLTNQNRDNTFVNRKIQPTSFTDFIHDYGKHLGLNVFMFYISSSGCGNVEWIGEIYGV